MLGKIRTAALSALIAGGALAALPASAQADSLYFGFGIGTPWSGYAQRHDRHSHDHRWERPRHRHRGYRACTPRRAVEKARRFGVHRARIVDVSRRTIHVVGRKHHRRVGMVFAKAPRCPVVRWR